MKSSKSQLPRAWSLPPALFSWTTFCIALPAPGEHNVIVENTRTGAVESFSAPLAFEHPRTPIADFHAAEQGLMKATRSLGRWLDPVLMFRARVVFEVPPYDGGITPIERRALRELASNMGFRQMMIMPAWRPEGVTATSHLKKYERLFDEKTHENTAC